MVILFYVTFVATVEGTLETFDRGAFAANLASSLRVPVAMVAITVRAGSVLVTSNITSTAPAAAEAVVAWAQDLSADGGAASVALGVRVESIRDIAVSAPIPVEANSLPETVSQVTANGEASLTSGVLIAVTAGSTLLVGLLVGLIALALRKRCQQRQMKALLSSMEVKAEPRSAASSNGMQMVSRGKVDQYGHL